MKMQTNVVLLRFAVVLCLCLSSANAAMALTPTTGAVVAMPAPPSLQYNAFESDTTIALITEQTNFELPGSVPLDVDGATGLYDQVVDLTGGVLPAGSRVDIHILHFDPVGAPRTLFRAMGSVTFDRPIVGLALRRLTLEASDFYGAAGTTYPTAATANFREFELNGGAIGVTDTVEISADQRTLLVDWGATPYFDQLRVFTAVPEPSALVVLSPVVAGSAVFGARRTRVRT
jgi:hypothetical protein